MIDPSRTPVGVTAVRIGRTDLGAAIAVLDDESMAVIIRVADERPIRIRLHSVDAAAVEGDELTLLLDDGTRVTIVTPAAERLAGDLLARCRTLPEVTLALRTFGSRRAMSHRRDSAPADQRRFFAPLLEARRAAGAAPMPAAVIAAFDAQMLAQAVADALQEFVAERHAESGPARRALEAELEEIVEPLVAAIHALGGVGAEAREAVHDLRLWRSWAVQLRVTFETADRVWISLDAALDIAPTRR